jgi:hypothetical protein
MFRGCAPKCCLENNAKFGEGIVQGVVKATQTGILWSQVQVLVGPPENLTLISNGGGFAYLALLWPFTTYL